MKSQHAKSPCCGARVRRFGARRRQCVECHRTWTVRPKKRGRPVHRTPIAVVQRVLIDGLTIGQLHSQRVDVELPAYRYRFRQALRRLVARAAAPPVARGPLVLLADGLWFEFDGAPWVLYLMALKPCGGNVATFIDPLMLPGREGASRWRQAIEAIPPGVVHRIQALVADNLPGMQKIARQRQWALQLCHFHLLLKLQVRRRAIAHSLRGGAVRAEIHNLVRSALELPAGPELECVLQRLERIAGHDCGTTRIQITVNEFLGGLRYYRTYLDHPALGLPRTSNAVESMCRLLREMLRSSRAGSNSESVRLWATALIRTRPKVVCNGYQINK